MVRMWAAANTDRRVCERGGVAAAAGLDSDYSGKLGLDAATNASLGGTSARARLEAHHRSFPLRPDVARRAGELSAEELERILVIVSNPRSFKIPDWFLNRQKDVKDGRYMQASFPIVLGVAPPALEGAASAWPRPGRITATPCVGTGWRAAAPGNSAALHVDVLARVPRPDLFPPTPCR